MVDGLERPDSQQLGELSRVQAITLVPDLAFAADVADHHPLHVRLQQIVQPLRLCALLERDMHSRTGTARERHDRSAFSRYRRPHRDRPALVPHARHHRCLVHVHREILNRLIFHGSRPFLSFELFRIQTYRKGRAFNMR